ncbi:MAG TPA: hypothetical protein ENG00_01015 [Candidatus Aenigmarchaeota archaeon]|nr:hypothetical protein [Candidatus Aenigmarchaeota archaeon]
MGEIENPCGKCSLYNEKLEMGVDALRSGDVDGIRSYCLVIDEMIGYEVDEDLAPVMRDLCKNCGKVSVYDKESLKKLRDSAQRVLDIASMLPEDARPLVLRMMLLYAEDFNRYILRSESEKGKACLVGIMDEALGLREIWEMCEYAGAEAGAEIKAGKPNS